MARLMNQLCDVRRSDRHRERPASVSRINRNWRLLRLRLGRVWQNGDHPWQRTTSDEIFIDVQNDANKRRVFFS
jgi:hypothetical protein